MKHRAALALFGLQLGILAPFVGRPPHVDDANFLRLAAGALADPWRPHAIAINWQGHTERAFDVLSNPPGIGWWLAPVVGAPAWAQHLWIWPWMALAAWGCARLCAALCPGNPGAAYVLGLSPLVLSAGASLTPDAPLFALTVAGLAGIVGGRGVGGALLLGAACLFRYSAVALLPLPGLYRLLQGDRRGALSHSLAAAAPLGLLLLHDLQAYGALHIQAMTHFQAIADTGRDLLRKELAAIGFLGGAGLLPLLGDRRPRSRALGLGLGLFAGALAIHLSDQQGAAALATLLALGAGGATLGAAAPDARSRWLGAVLLLGLLFFSQLRFMAGRYWLPFLPAAALLALRNSSPRATALAALAQSLVAFGLLVDDDGFARAQAKAAAALQALPAGQFSGHWGWQAGMEAAGWSPVEEDAPLPPGTFWAASAASWPQEPAPGCTLPRGQWALPRPGLRLVTHSPEGAANLHAFVISADPPVESYAPWTLSAAPYDTITLAQACPTPTLRR